nr:MAG TPA: hypothetical protein [Caudoviricetes sp.]
MRLEKEVSRDKGLTSYFLLLFLLRTHVWLIVTHTEEPHKYS